MNTGPSYQFYTGADGYTVQEELTKTQIAGIVTGFTVLGCLLIYAIILITMDVYSRKAEYLKEVEEDKKELKSLGFTDAEIEELKQKFHRMESMDSAAAKE